MLLIAFLFLAMQTGPQANTAFEQGNQLFTAGKLQEALAAYDQAAGAEPKRAEIQLARCRTLAGLRRFDEGIAACDRAIQLKPISAEAFRDRGHYKLNLGHMDDAQRDLEHSERLNSNDRGTYYHLGLAHYFKAEFRESAEQFEGCARNSKEKVDVMECDAWLYPALFRAGQKAEAQKLLDGIASDPNITGHPAWYLDRLLLFKGAKTEDQVGANLNAEGALSLESVGYSIGLWHLLNGREAKAREYYQKVLSGDMPFAWGYRATEADMKRLTSNRQ
jgi:tetratricopeptide (TPR) repeat protein